jgi:hypothetical protein
MKLGIGPTDYDNADCIRLFLITVEWQTAVVA